MDAHIKDNPDLPFGRDGIIRRPLGLKSEIQADLNADYASEIILRLRENDNRLTIGGLTFRLARNFGFCYGVDKAIDMAYESRRRFPDRLIFLTTEIIHNPRVNGRLIEMGIRFLSGPYADGTAIEDIQPEDVVLLPAFGAEVGLVDRLRARGCILVDTTCGSVVHVWKRVEKYAREGYTALIHGKHWHEETMATCSHVTEQGGKFLIVLNKAEAAMVCDFLRTGEGAAALAAHFPAAAHSPGFNFKRDLLRVGVANQTTMLASESLEIGEMARAAMTERWGGGAIEEHYRHFGTICSATQENQDAVMEIMQDPPDVMMVVGGFNSSNTSHLAKIAGEHTLAWHIADVDCLISPVTIRHRPTGKNNDPVEARDWLPARRPLSIGLTAGASTPNRVLGEVIERLVEFDQVSDVQQ